VGFRKVTKFQTETKRSFSEEPRWGDQASAAIWVKGGKKNKGQGLSFKGSASLESHRFHHATFCSLSRKSLGRGPFLPGDPEKSRNFKREGKACGIGTDTKCFEKVGANRIGTP